MHSFLKLYTPNLHSTVNIYDNRVYRGDIFWYVVHVRKYAVHPIYNSACSIHGSEICSCDTGVLIIIKFLSQVWHGYTSMLNHSHLRNIVIQEKHPITMNNGSMRNTKPAFIPADLWYSCAFSDHLKNLNIK